MEVVINSKWGGGFSPSVDILKALFKVEPHLFTPVDHPELYVNPGQSLADLEELYSFIEKDGIWWQLKSGDEVRCSPYLISLLKDNGPMALGSSSLKVVEIPDDIEWYIYEDDSGAETIHEAHRIWR